MQGELARPLVSGSSLSHGGFKKHSRQQVPRPPSSADKDFRCCPPRRSTGLPSKGGTSSGVEYKSVATWLWKHCSRGTLGGQKNTCVMKDAVHRWATVGELNKSCFSNCVCVCEWVHVAGPDDSDWVIQGRVCALSVCLLFYSHMDLRPLMKSARLPDPALGSSHINSSQQKCSGSLLAQNLNEPAYGFRRMQMRSGSHFPSLTSRLAVRTHMFGGKMWPFRERTTRGWKRSPVLNSILGVWGGL